MKENLTLEQQACNYETTKHIRRVQALLNKVATALIRRGEMHDETKLHSPEVELFAEYTDKLAGCTYNSPEYNNYRKELSPALDHHYKNNSHHPEFYENNEKWKNVVGYEGFYEVSNYGRIRSLDRLVERNVAGNFIKNGQIIKSYLTPKGYLTLSLSKGNKTKNHLVHRLVAEAFIDNPFNKNFVNHKNNIKYNNFVENLEWVTSSENLLHAYENGFKEPTVKYVVKCIELDIVTEGCLKMEQSLRKLGHNKAASSSIWRCINCETDQSHLDLHFEGFLIESLGDISFVDNMNLLDVIEMFCDWKAASERHTNGNILDSIKINQKRFNIAPQLAQIFQNTIEVLENQ